MTVIEVRGVGLDQRLDALRSANVVRSFKADRKEMIANADDPWLIVAGMLRDPQGAEGAFGLREAVCSIPKVGSARLHEMCRRGSVPRDRKLRDMTLREREFIAAEVDKIGARRRAA